MARSTRERALVKELLARHGRTFAEELRIPVRRGTPAALFQLLCASILFSARISANIATRAAADLRSRGWTTPRRMAGSTWAERTRTLNRAGYARYDERTSRMLGDTAKRVLERYGGDLRRLRDEAKRDPRREHELLQQFKGIGGAGADIFLREAQVAWKELVPYADRQVRNGARALGLPADPKNLRRLAGDRYPQLAAALVRGRLQGDLREIARSAS